MRRILQTNEPPPSRGIRARIKYQAQSHGRIEGDIKVPFFLSHDRELAEMYADEDGVPAFEDLSKHPLLLDTPEKFVEAWQASGADDVEGDFYPTQTHAFAKWARLQGYDAIVIPDSAFEGDLGYDEVASVIGDPQTVILDPQAVRRVIE